MKATVFWTVKTNGLGNPIAKPEPPSEFDLPTTGFVLDLLGFAFGGLSMRDIEGTALAQAITTEQPTTVDTNQPDNGLGIVSATATPLGGGRYEVEYEVME